MSYPLKTARAIAEKIIADISPFCVRCDIAGSVRREKAEVKDIEIVCIPRFEDVPGEVDLFGAKTERRNILQRHLQAKDTVRWIKPGTSVIEDWPLKPEAKYWRGLMPNGIKLDVFLANEHNYGMIYLMRTGSAEFNVGLFTKCKQSGVRAAGGYLWEGGKPLSTPEERDVFTWAGIKWVEPWGRLSAADVKRSESYFDSQPTRRAAPVSDAPIGEYVNYSNGEIHDVEILEESPTQVRIRFLGEPPVNWSSEGWFPRCYLV